MSPPKTVAYLRVSSADQDLEKNKADILHVADDKGLGRVEWVEEKLSGRVSWKKRKIAQVLERLQAKDNLIVSELSRLGRSMLIALALLAKQ
jgi:DNA invertase Pin-like site-specific DNA recombinase